MSDVFGISVSALQAFQAAINVTSNNVANASTPGYDRETINLTAAVPQSNGTVSVGSGVVVSETGLVLTNAHVVHNATKIYVRLPGGRGSWADIHASDPRSDLAVLRLLSRVPNLKAIKIGEGERIRKGQFVLSLANPFAPGFRDGSPSASWGIVSNLRRRVPGRDNELEQARTDAVANIAGGDRDGRRRCGPRFGNSSV